MLSYCKICQSGKYEISGRDVNLADDFSEFTSVFDTDFDKIPAGSQLVRALADANCTPLQSELTAKPSTVHVTVTCEVPVLIPGESFELPIELHTRTQQRVITLTTTMSEDDSDSGNNSNQIATSLDAGADIQVAGPS